ncbi:DUF456 domain-containing protein [filamentous cyanobacterium CCP5]|nr:DUF456 domain-containing protein [filamentous cyanobacterium CCP5]
MLYWILVAVMIAGAIGELIPGLPGASLILLSILVWALATGFSGIGWPILVVFALLIASAGIELLAAAWGAQRFGATRWGQFGALIGLVVGALGLLPALPVGGPIIGILVGPFIGAFIGEYLTRQDVEGESKAQAAFKASLGTVVGTFLGNLLDGLLAIAAVVVFILSTWPLVSSLAG